MSTPNPPPITLDGEDGRRAAPEQLIRACKFCEGQVVFVQLINGWWRTFEPYEYLTDRVMSDGQPRTAVFALRWPYLRAVCLNDTIDLPRWCLMTHFCSQYHERKSEVSSWSQRLAELNDIATAESADVPHCGFCHPETRLYRKRLRSGEIVATACTWCHPERRR